MYRRLAVVVLFISLVSCNSQTQQKNSTTYSKLDPFVATQTSSSQSTPTSYIYGIGYGNKCLTPYTMGVETFIVENLQDNDTRLYAPNPKTGVYITDPEPLIPNSLREVLLRPNKYEKMRRIVFKKGGNLFLKNFLDIPSNSHIDGVALDGKSVTIRDYNVRIQDSHNILLTRLRLRPGLLAPHINLPKYPYSAVKARTWQTNSPESSFNIIWDQTYQNGWGLKVSAIDGKPVEIYQQFLAIPNQRYAIFVDGSGYNMTVKAWINDSQQYSVSGKYLTANSSTYSSCSSKLRSGNLIGTYQAPSSGTMESKLTIQASGPVSKYSTAILDNIFLLPITSDFNFEDPTARAKLWQQGFLSEYGSKEAAFAIYDGRFDKFVGDEVHAIEIYGKCSDITIDKCSLSWGNDENISMVGDVQDITISNCVIGPPINIGHRKGEHGASFMATTKSHENGHGITLYNNLFVGGLFRVPQLDCSESKNSARWDIVNNIFYGYKVPGAYYDNLSVNFLNNLWFGGTEFGYNYIRKPLPVSNNMKESFYLENNYDVMVMKNVLDYKSSSSQALLVDISSGVLKNSPNSLGTVFSKINPIGDGSLLNRCIGKTLSVGCQPYDDVDINIFQQVSQGFTDRDKLMNKTIYWSSKTYGGVESPDFNGSTWTSQWKPTEISMISSKTYLIGKDIPLLSKFNILPAVNEILVSNSKDYAKQFMEFKIRGYSPKLLRGVIVYTNSGSVLSNMDTELYVWNFAQDNWQKIWQFYDEEVISPNLGKAVVFGNGQASELNVAVEKAVNKTDVLDSVVDNDGRGLLVWRFGPNCKDFQKLQTKIYALWE